MARTCLVLPRHNGKPTSHIPSHPTSPLRLLRTQTATVTLCSTSTPASFIQRWAPLTCCIRGREQRCSVGHSTVRYELWAAGTWGNGRPASWSKFPLQCLSQQVRVDAEEIPSIRELCEHSHTLFQTHLLTSSNSCCSWKTTVIASGYCSQSRFFMLWFLLCFCNSVGMKPGTYVNTLTFDINMNWSIFLYFVFVLFYIFCDCNIYTVFAKINMQILPSLLLLYVIMVKGIV